MAGGPPVAGPAVRGGLALVWLYAGATKVGDLAASGRAVHAYQIMPYELSQVVGAALPFVEIALGVLLLLGVATRLAAGVSAALLVIFIAGIVSAWARGLAIDCGCFGTGGDSRRRRAELRVRHRAGRRVPPARRVPGGMATYPVVGGLRHQRR